MTIDEAIKRLKECNDVTHRFDWVEFNQAIQLGIQALKRIRDSRVAVYNPINRTLPGETKE